MRARKTTIRPKRSRTTKMRVGDRVGSGGQSNKSGREADPLFEWILQPRRRVCVSHRAFAGNRVVDDGTLHCEAGAAAADHAAARVEALDRGRMNCVVLPGHVVRLIAAGKIDRVGRIDNGASPIDCEAGAHGGIKIVCTDAKRPYC